MDKGKIARATVIVTGATILSKILGFGREVVLAAIFGASAATDAYLVALIIPALFFGIVASTVSMVGIPVFSEYLHQASKRKELNELIWLCFHALLIIFAALVLFGLLGAPWLVRILAPGFSFPQVSLATEMVRIMLPIIILMGLAGWAQGVLNAHQHFVIPSLIGVPYNIIMIGGIIFAGASTGIYGVAWATLLATASQFLIQIPVLTRYGIIYRRPSDWRHPALRKMFWLAVPVIIGVGANQLNTIIDRMLASGLAEGSISALSYAQRVLGIAQGLFAVPLITVLYPSLTKRAALADLDGLREVVTRGISLFVFLLLPLTAGMIVLRFELVQFLFQRGAFDDVDAKMTAVALLFYAPGLLFLVWRDLLSRTFYAVQNTFTPMWTGLVTVFINVILNLILVRPLAHGGLALASSISAAIGCLLLIVCLQRCFIRASDLFSKGEIARVVAAALLMSLGVWWFSDYALDAAGWLVLVSRVEQIWGNSTVAGFVLQGLRLFLLIGAGVLIYLLCCRVFKIKELDYILALLRKKSFFFFNKK